MAKNVTSTDTGIARVSSKTSSMDTKQPKKTPRFLIVDVSKNMLRRCKIAPNGTQHGENGATKTFS